ncbi:type 1 glutamine amidotransferase [Sphingomonas sp. Tas61C01]|uniref:type 1 glutamine amidotransferase n=1 Tax=Sphingomonas sp. Tas61C01 TaxID=3458297 RepID=UPI00403EE77D
MQFLVAESETPDEREARRESAGKSSGETYAATLAQMRPDATITIVAPADADPLPLTADEIAAYNAVFITGSPLHVYDDTPEVRRQIAFMRAVFDSGVPSFGSCAGLQLAVVAAGGRVRKMADRLEAGIARRIVATETGRTHPLLAGRPTVWDAPGIHGDEVEALPADADLLASNAVTRVQAAEIRHHGSVFWGVQYHPELAIGEIAAALRRQAPSLVDSGLANDIDEVETLAERLDRLHRAPDDRAARWLLGVDDQFAREDRRRTEIGNFLANLALLRRNEENDMAKTLTASFDTRREAEMTIERLVQDHGFDRNDIFVVAEGDENSAGLEVAGSDNESAQPSPETRDDAALEGRIKVSVDIEDDDRAETVRAAFAEFDAEQVAAN